MQFNKEVLRQEFFKLENENLLYSRKTYEDYLGLAKLDRDRTIDDQDRSQAQQAGLLAEHFECPLHDHEVAIKKLENLNLSKKVVVEPGALVKFNKKYFLVGIASGSVKLDNEQFIGLSTNAPIFNEIEGLSVGEEFIFKGNKIKIEDIQ